MQSLLPKVQFDTQLLQKYNQPVPRYTSYPPATELTSKFEEIDFRAAIAVSNYKKTPLSLYCHIPFCDTPCYFCGCNTVITPRKELTEPYLGYLIRHIEQFAPLISSDRVVHQMHWGGGTPNYLSLQEIETLFNAIHNQFTFDSDAELSIEVNPKSLTREILLALRNLGFNRISFGIQDFDPLVQETVNRIQPESMLFGVMDGCREAGFDQVNVDLIYGLPYQTVERFRETIHKTIQLNPDRIAVFSFAYVPWLKPVQKRLPQEFMPDGEEKLQILKMTIEELTQNGYHYIGMDHFAKPDDELAIAQRDGTLHRNFQGYTTKPDSDMMGFGITSISMLNEVYVQNHKGLKEFYRDIDANKMPISKGVKLSPDDIIRRTIIMELMCQFNLSPTVIEEKYHLGFDLDFDTYFAAERNQLQHLEGDGLLRLSPNHIEVTPAGRLLIRNIASAFDQYLKKNGALETPKFSKAL